MTNESVSQTDDGSFSTLQIKINELDDDQTIHLNNDYVNDNLGDEGIIISKNITIDGNGFTLNGLNKSRIFTINSGNVVLNNINFINGFSDIGGAILCNQTFTCNNLTFKNNHANYGGAIYTYNIKLDGCTFEANDAIKGSALEIKLLTDSDFQPNIINNTTFKNMKNNPIYIDAFDDVFINNSLFENITSQYAAAILTDCTFVTINNTKFRNLNTNIGGTVTLLGTFAKIYNCDFNNISSSANGGAIYSYTKSVDAVDSLECYFCNFNNCFSDYGGVIAKIFGRLSINSCNFKDNFAEYDGGSIYVSGLNNFTLENSTFTNNKLKNSNSNGGAIYSFFTENYIINTTFTNNTNNAIYLFDCDYDIINSEFKNNMVAICSYYPKSVLLKNNDYNNDKVENYSDFNYGLIIEDVGIPIELTNNTIDVKTLPSRFDSREWGWISPVKNQYNSNACWAFSTMSALESSLLRSTSIRFNASIQNMEKNSMAYSKYGDKENSEGGDFSVSSQYLISWFGPIPEKYDYFNEYSKIDGLIPHAQSIHIQDILFTPICSDLSNHDYYKKLIMDHGAVAITCTFIFDDLNSSALYRNDTSANHAVTLVGWDDNYPASNFQTTPPGDGAWIIKNSYGAESHDNGYFYLSYYDSSFVNTKEGMVVLFVNTENYTKNYQTDFEGSLIIKDSMRNYSYKNSYQSIGNDLISAVGTYFNYTNEPYSLEIYVNDELKLTQSGNAPFFGYHTIKLDKNIPIKKGDNFTAVMNTESVPILENSHIHYKKNISFVDDGWGWEDLALSGNTVVLKVYTKDLAFYTEDLVKIYKNNSNFVANIGIANENVTFEICDIKYTHLSDENGTAKLNINLNPGNYTIRTTFNGTSIENSIEVLPTLIAQDLVKYYKNESQFIISLIDGYGASMTNVNITMNINGVFYNRTTNENGTARLNINLNPGTYILTAQDSLSGLMMSYNITVLPILIADNLNMSYLNGSQFKLKLIDGAGNPLANKNVTFNINGVFYTRLTNTSGIACLNIRLIPGEYIITSQYESSVTSNKITIHNIEE